MNCPICGSELIEGVGRRYETLGEHVSNPNGIPSLKQTFVCDNESYVYPYSEEETNCPFRYSMFWDWMGDYYGVLKGFDMIREHESFLKKNLCHNQMFEARNSHTRKSKVEIYTKKEVKLPRFLKWRWDIRFKITADEDGNIVKQKPYIQMFSTDDNGKSWSYTSTFITSFLHNVQSFKNTLRHYKEYPTNKYVREELEKEFEPLPDWDKRFYRQLYNWYVHTFYYKLENKLKAKRLLNE